MYFFSYNTIDGLQAIFNEEKIQIEKQKLIEQRMLKELNHECRENDANVSIRDRYEMEKYFKIP